MKKKDYSKKPLLVFISYIADHKAMFAVDMICALLVSVIDLLFPIVSRHSMNTLLPERRFTTFFVVMGILILAYLLKAVLYYVITVVGHRMGVRVEADMRRDIFAHMQTLSFRFYDKNRTGTLLSRMTSDLVEITELAHHGPENLLICTLSMVGSLVIVFFLEWRLALVLAIVMPFCLGFTMAQRTRLIRANIEVKKKTADIFSTIESSLSGVRTSKAFANEEEELAKFNQANRFYVKAKSDYYRTMGTYMSSMEFTAGIAPVLVIAVGGALMMAGTMDFVDLVTFTLYVTVFVSPLRKLIMFTELCMQGSAGFGRFLELMRAEPDLMDAPDARTLENVRGQVDFEHVSFHYDNGVPVLKDIDLHIQEGQTLALVGPSGGGKTTLCHLLPRFYDVCGGSIKVDGNDVRELTQASLRRNIGIIQQDVFMFAGTIKENIRYGRPDATDEEIIEAAIKAEIHKEILEMPDGYDSQIGERGVKLSGGQKQRISIARVFLKNPKILILDEATSALDTVTERHIQQSLNQLSQGRTSIIIAHRLSTIKDADLIAVIDEDRVAELGSHEELMAKDGLYAGLCRAQMLTN